jgi:peptide deformylase
MAKLTIRTYPDPVLKAVAQEFSEITDEDRKLAQDMLETMFAGNGVGLAAPQVGVSRRLIVCSPEFKRGKEYVFFNPKILSATGRELGPEGCLSLPGISGEVVRATHVEFEALDLKGRKIQMKLDDFFARVVQHEIDHLDGVLYVDRVKFSDRKNLMEAYHEAKAI